MLRLEEFKYSDLESHAPIQAQFKLIGKELSKKICFKCEQVRKWYTLLIRCSGFYRLVGFEKDNGFGGQEMNIAKIEHVHYTYTPALHHSGVYTGKHCMQISQLPLPVS